MKYFIYNFPKPDLAQENIYLFLFFFWRQCFFLYLFIFFSSFKFLISYITNNTNTYTTYDTLYYLQWHTILTLLTIQTLTLLLLLTMPYHYYITNNTNFNELYMVLLSFAPCFFFFIFIVFLRALGSGCQETKRTTTEAPTFLKQL